MSGIRNPNQEASCRFFLTKTGAHPYRFCRRAPAMKSPPIPERAAQPPELDTTPGADHQPAPLTAPHRAPASPTSPPPAKRAGSAGHPQRPKTSPPERRHDTPAEPHQTAPRPVQAQGLTIESRRTRFARLSLATLAVIQALYQSGRPVTAIAAATGTHPATVAKHAKLQGWQRLTAGMTQGHDNGCQDERRTAPGAGLAVIAHQQAAKDLRERLAVLCADPALGATASGSLAKAALELSRALTVAVTLERRLLGLEDAGGDKRGPGVVIVVPAQQSPADWNRSAVAQRKASQPRRRAIVTVQDGPPPEAIAGPGDDSPDLDAED